MKFLNKIYLSLLALLLVTTIQAQSYNNEWIDYSKTYYKFKLSKNGLYRIDGATLSSVGLSNAVGNQIQLWRNGQQVPIFVSSDATLGSTDYIEFWGQRNDGSVDAELFKNPADQLNKDNCFETDSATYFLTINTNTAQNFRLVNASNDVSSKPVGLQPEPYFLYTIQNNLGNTINNGPATIYGGDYVYSSDYKAKTFGAVISPSASATTSFTNLFPYTGGGVAGSLSVGIAGSSVLGTQRQITVSSAGNTLINQPLLKFDAKVFTNTSVTVNGDMSISIQEANSDASDRATVSFASLTYPRTFNFGNQSSFAFSLPQSTQQRYLEITNFNANSSTPVLYDLTNDKRYTAVVNGSVYQFLLPASNSAQYAMVGQSATSYSKITTGQISVRQFPDYSNTSNQANFIIISNKALYGDGNYVQQYADYRSSAAGGSYNAKVYNIEDLQDEFAFGIKTHPIGIKNFLRFARNHFAQKPAFAMIIGRGLTFDNNRGANESNLDYQSQNLVPTYGWPASDIMLASDDFQPLAATPIGRLSAVKPAEIQNYLDKVKAYESGQKTDDNTVANNAWKKNIVFISGGGNTSEDNLFTGYLNSYKSIMGDTLYGSNNYFLSKTTSDAVSSSSGTDLKNLFANGLGLISYFGHGASTTIGYGELSDPSIFNNNGKYPVVFTSGCDVGDCFSYMPGRSTAINNITERYLLSKDNGSVAFVAETYLGVTSFLHQYNIAMYNGLATKNYDQPITTSMLAGSQSLFKSLQTASIDSITAYAHAEQTNFFGDPSISLYHFSKPDFAVEESEVYAPASVSISQSKFHVSAYLYNLGQATGDSLLVQVQRKLSNGTTEMLLQKNIASIHVIDSIALDVPIDPNKDLGNNDIIITLDGNAHYDELSETNNTVTKTVYVYANGITPVYPYKYGIVHQQQQHVFASTSDALAATTAYVMEMDTVQTFNSLFKITKTINSVGGVIDFDPGISYADSTVYYWRVSPVPSGTDDYRWAGSSFQYIASSDDGASQAGLYQQLESGMERIKLDSTLRQWVFGDRTVSVYLAHAVQQGSYGPSSFVVQVNGHTLSSYYCPSVGNSIMFNVLDANGFNPYFDQAQPSLVQNPPFGGFMGAVTACGATPYSYDVDPSYNSNKSNFQFSFQTKANRDNIANFMNWIPDGSYVIARIFINTPFSNVPLVDAWKADGTDETTLYNQFLAQGLTNIDAFTSPKIGVFIFKKNDQSFEPIQKLTDDVNGQIIFTQGLNVKDTLGYITSPKFGPALSWKSVQWNGRSIDSVNTDLATVNILGVDSTGNTSLLNTLTMGQQNFDISNIDAKKYPYIQLKMRNADSINYTPYQLKYWDVKYTPVPEGALAANIQLVSKDTIELGEDLKFAIAFKNVSDQVFEDSILANVILQTSNNTVYNILVHNLKPIQPGDTALINITIPGDTAAYNATQPDLLKMPIGTLNIAGANTLSIDVNPANKQPEETHDNNFLFKNFFVKSDVYNPLLDVTFDGVHILDNDIVAAKPNISIRLSSDSKYLLLNDTSMAKVSLKYPDGTIRSFGYNSDTLSFSPATDSSKNEALINFKPYLTQDGEYTLMVQGQGKGSDESTVTNYSVSFQVYNAPMISDMFNYPNPFTSSTAFVFTITGSEVPQNIRIQILTITGKIVKEITKEELGPLHIGRNITDYKWDGTDSYGQKLANGVYLYRVITNQDGKSLGHFGIKDANGNSINTGQYFNKGYGKMYLMR